MGSDLMEILRNRWVNFLQGAKVEMELRRILPRRQPIPNEPVSFGKIRFGRNVKYVKGLRFEGEEHGFPDVQVYTREDERTLIGKLRPSEIQYVFWKGKFASFRILSYGEKGYEDLQKQLAIQYGKPRRGTGLGSPSAWNGSRVVIEIIFDPKEDLAMADVKTRAFWRYINRTIMIGKNAEPGTLPAVLSV